MTHPVAPQSAGDILDIGGAHSSVGFGSNPIEVREATGPVGWTWRRITAEEKQRLLNALNTRASSPPADGRGLEECAYQSFKFLEWRGVRKDRDDFVRAEWQKLPDENRVGQCNIDCNCDHTFYGKNHYRELSAALRNPLVSDEGKAETELKYLAIIHKRFVGYLATRYNDGEALDIANWCDNVLDQSGRLLGEVRDIARIASPSHDTTGADDGT